MAGLAGFTLILSHFAIRFNFNGVANWGDAYDLLIKVAHFQ